MNSALTSCHCSSRHSSQGRLVSDTEPSSAKAQKSGSRPEGSRAAKTCFRAASKAANANWPCACVHGSDPDYMAVCLCIGQHDEEVGRSEALNKTSVTWSQIFIYTVKSWFKYHKSCRIKDTQKVRHTWSSESRMSRFEEEERTNMWSTTSAARAP